MSCGSRFPLRVCALIALAQALTATSAYAQVDALAARCAAHTPAVPAAHREHCEHLAYAVAIAHPRAVLIASGGQPVPGAASTLGTRVGTLPRLSLTARGTGMRIELPPIESAAASRTLRFTAPSFSLDGAVGVYGGVPIVPTVGGFGSVDLLGSVGVLALPGGSGFRSRPGTWGVGARLGVLRESFTMPGLSLSAMYRGVGDIRWGDPTVTSPEGFFAIDASRALSLRGTVGKRFHGLGFNGGIGWDRATSDVELRQRLPSPLIGPPPPPAVEHPGFRTRRSNAFVGVSWTTLLFHVAGEVGVQAGGSGAATTPQARDLLERRGYYASLAARLAL